MRGNSLVHLTGLVDWIISAVAKVFDWLFQKVLFWLLNLVYEALIYVPLQIINAIAIIFRFFCGGFVNYVFGDGTPIFDPSTGHFNIDVDQWLHSTLGIMVMFTFGVGMIIFFIYLMLSFTNGNGQQVDANGKVLTGTNRLSYLKWPMFMIGSLFLFPYVIVFVNFFVQELMLFFNGGKAAAFTQDQINALQGNMYGDLGTMKTIGNGSIYDPTDTTFTNPIKFSDILQRLDENTRTLLTVLAHQTGDTIPSQIFVTQIKTLEQDITDIQSCITDWTNPNTSSITAVQNILMNLKAGDYLSSENAQTISNLSIQMQGLYADINDLPSIGTTIGDSQYDDLWNTLALGTYQTDSFVDVFTGEHVDIPLQGQGVALSALFTTPLKSIGDSLTNAVPYDNSLGFFTTTCYRLTDSSTVYLTLSQLPFYQNGMEQFQICGIIYSLITGDPNQANWTQPYGNGFSKKANVLQWVFGIFSTWYMIIVVYTYTAESIKTIFFVIGYWVIGFVYLGTGIRNEKEAKGWFASIFWKYMGIIIISLCFEFAGVLVNILEPVIKKELAGQYSIGGIDILSEVGMILSMEAGFQVGYMIYKRFMDERGAGVTGQSYAAPTMLSQGKGLLNTAAEGLEYWGTGGPVKDMYNKVDSYDEYWKGKYDTKLKREGGEWQRAQRITGMAKMKEDLNKNGYDFVGSNGSDPGSLKRITSGNQAVINNPPAPAAPAAAGPVIPPAPPAPGQPGYVAPGAGWANGGGLGNVGGGNVANLAPVPPAAPVLRNINSGSDAAFATAVVPKNFVAYKKADGTYLQGKDNKWYNGGSFGANLKNLGRAAVAGISRGAEAAHDAAAWVGRKAIVGNMVIGAAGLFGGDRARAQAQRVFGSSKHRLSHAEKQFAEQNAASGGIAKNTKTGVVTIIPPVAPTNAVYTDNALYNAAGGGVVGRERSSKLGEGGDLLY